MNEWTNAVKAGVVAVVNTGVALLVAILTIVEVVTDPQELGVLVVAIDAFANAVMGLWILLTYKMSNARAEPATLKRRGLKP